MRESGRISADDMRFYGIYKIGGLHFTPADPCKRSSVGGMSI